MDKPQAERFLELYGMLDRAYKRAATAAASAPELDKPLLYREAADFRCMLRGMRMALACFGYEYNHHTKAIDAHGIPLK